MFESCRAHRTSACKPADRIRESGSAETHLAPGACAYENPPVRRLLALAAAWILAQRSEQSARAQLEDLRHVSGQRHGSEGQEIRRRRRRVALLLRVQQQVETQVLLELLTKGCMC